MSEKQKQPTSGCELDVLSKAFGPKSTSLVIPESWRTGEADGDVMTTLDLTRPEARSLMMNTLNGDAISLEKVLNVPFMLAGYSIMPASKLDEDTGEIVRLIRTVLYTPDGKLYHCFSDKIVKSLRSFDAVYGKEWLAKPVRCVCERVPVGESKGFYRLRPIDP
jgi:hypothetical protein